MLKSYNSLQEGEEAVYTLYKDLIHSWNERNAILFASLFEEQGNIIGFDGGQLNNRSEIERSMLQIFNHLQTAAYVAIIRNIRLIDPKVALIRSVVGMIPSGKKDISPGLNAIHSIVATEKGNEWKISQLQITPAQFHAYPKLSEELSEELRNLISNTF